MTATHHFLRYIIVMKSTYELSLNLFQQAMSFVNNNKMVMSREGLFDPTIQVNDVASSEGLNELKML